MGRRPPISGLPEIGFEVRKSAKADLRWRGFAARLRVTDHESRFWRAP
jgi:hypothetical protein